LKYISIFILSFIFFSCSKEKKTISIDKNQDSISFFLKRYKANQDVKYLDKSFEILKTQNNNLSIRNLLSDLVVEFYKNNNTEKLNSASKLLIQLSFDSKDSTNLGMAYRSRGNFYYKTKNLDSSYFFYIKAEKIYNKLNDDKNYSNILMNKGIIQYAKGDYLGAELSLNKAHSIFNNSTEFNKIYGSLDQLGLVAIELKEYDKAFFYFTKALDAIKNLPIEEDRIYYTTVCKNNLGYLFLKSHDYKKAIFYFEEALFNKLIKKDDPLLYSNLIDNLAYCKLNSNTSSSSPDLFFEALEIRKSFNSYTEVVGSYIHLSEYYQKTNDISSSIKYSNEALRVARESKIPVNIVLALKQASNVDDKNALKYSNDYIRISDSLQIAERNSKDRFARIELETDELKKANIDLEAKNRDILNYFMGTMLFVGVLFFMRAQRARRRELILVQAQQRANEEIYKLIITQQNKLDEGRVMEKSRIAKELHDGVLGRMFGLRLNLDGLNKRDDESAVQERLRCLEELKIIEQDLREISHELSREKYVLINNFVAIVNSLLEDQSKVNTAILNYKIGVDIDWDLLSNTTKINLYRILQETLQNINKYAKAKNIKVEFKKDKKGNLILNIADDGIGFDVAKKSKGIGLKNIVTRTHESEGTIEIKSFIDKGSQIKITVPLDSKSIKI
jgi:signal transduction histidine kinase/Tfp pilus assembly protein PilF